MRLEIDNGKKHASISADALFCEIDQVYERKCPE
jgi:hypothetical protein